MDKKMRLDKFLADMSLGTRSEVKKIIASKRIKVNGSIVNKADYQVKEVDEIYFDDQLINYVDYEYYVLNKPKGYICATEDKNYPVVMELINSKRKDLVPIGRLDKDTEGLLLISNDGKLNHHLLSPKSHVIKKYYVEVDTKIPENAEEIFAREMDLGDFIAKPALFERINETSAYLSITEGKYHQVKRMFEKIGCTVTYLKRMEFKNLNLDGLDVGQYRSLTEEEISNLKN